MCVLKQVSKSLYQLVRNSSYIKLIIQLNGYHEYDIDALITDHLTPMPKEWWKPLQTTKTLVMRQTMR